MRFLPPIRRAASRLAARAAVCGWVLALVVGAQGWVPVGAEWYAGAGRSLWSPCGSAMCACPASVKSPARPATEASCCPDEPVAQADEAPALPLLVALGGERRDDSRSSSMPESLVLELPSAPSGQIDRVFATGRELVRESSLRALAELEVTPPPPRA